MPNQGKTNSHTVTTSRRPEDIGPKQKLSPALPPAGGLETLVWHLLERWPHAVI